VGVVERAGRAEEIRKQQIAVDQAIDGLIPRALLERSQSFARLAGL